MTQNGNKHIKQWQIISVSDQGREFINSVNSELQVLLGTHHRMTSPYYPQTNGLVESFNHSTQSCLLKVV